MKKSALLSITTAVISLSFLTAHTTYAQTSSLTVIPPRLELTSDPGKVIQTQVQLKNETDSTLYYAVRVDNFIVSDEQGTPIPIPDTITSRWGLKAWIKAPTIIPIDPHTLANVRLSITVPKNALPGGHYALISYQPNPDSTPRDLSQTGSLIGQRAGTIIYLLVNGPINQNASIKEFKVPKFNETGPIDFTGIIQNDSDIHINAKGSLIISNILGQEIVRLPVETGNIFPSALRAFKVTWPQKWGYGRYTATLDLAYGTAGGVLSATLTFWLFPIRLVIYILIIIISLLFVFIALKERSKRHEAALEKEVQELKKEIEKIDHKP